MGITLYHPVLEARVTVRTETQAVIHERSGWKRATPPDPTKKELLEVARALDIEGASQMTKAELADAVRAAQENTQEGVATEEEE